MENLECNDDVQRAIEHIANDEIELGLEILNKYKGCHLTNLNCVYNGSDCMMQDLISGFVKISEDMAKD